MEIKTRYLEWGQAIQEDYRDTAAGKKLRKQKLSWDSDWQRTWRGTRSFKGKTKARVSNMWTHCWITWGQSDKGYRKCLSTQCFLCLRLYWQCVLPVPGPSQVPGPRCRVCGSQVLLMLEEEWASDNLNKLGIHMHSVLLRELATLTTGLLYIIFGLDDQGKFLMMGNLQESWERRL